VRGEGRGRREGEVEVEVEERKREGLRKACKAKRSKSSLGEQKETPKHKQPIYNLDNDGQRIHEKYHQHCCVATVVYYACPVPLLSDHPQPCQTTTADAPLRR
jgi:hypothetical protein